MIETSGPQAPLSRVMVFRLASEDSKGDDDRNNNNNFNNNHSSCNQKIGGHPFILDAGHLYTTGHVDPYTRITYPSSIHNGQDVFTVLDAPPPATRILSRDRHRVARHAEEEDGSWCCCCCCRWLCGSAYRKRSARVTPEKHHVIVHNDMQHRPAADGLAIIAPQEAAPLTLDSIDSYSLKCVSEVSPPHERVQAGYVPTQKPVLVRLNNSPPTNETHPLPPDLASSGKSESGQNSAGSGMTGHLSGQTSGHFSTISREPSTSTQDSAEQLALFQGLDDSVHAVSSRDSAISAITNGTGSAGETPALSQVSLRTGDDALDGDFHQKATVFEHLEHHQTSSEAALSPLAHEQFETVTNGVKRAEISPPPKKSLSGVRRGPVRPGRGVRVPLSRPRAGTPGSLSLSSNLSSSMSSTTAALFADTLPGFDNPREALTRGLQQLDSMEWEVTLQALQTLVRLVRHHPALVLGQLHACCEALARQVRNLRSQVARAACQAASHIFHTLRRGMDGEAEDLSAALFNRTADTNKFLRADSNIALDAMADTVSPAKAISAIVHKGCRHQNAVVRTSGARLLLRLVDKLGVDRVMSQPRETRDLLLLTSARLLMEGSLETRSYTKALLKNLAQDARLGSILVEIVPTNVMRSIDKTLKSCLARK